MIRTEDVSPAKSPEPPTPMLINEGVIDVASGAVNLKIGSVMG